MKPSSIKFQVLAMLFGLGLTACGPSVKEIAIEPPFENVELPRQELTLDPSKEQVVKFESGVTVDVPADAFVDAKGNPVNGEVTLQLKTFETPAEIIASGIPMTFEDGDQTRDFESAGMFQIQGLANGQEIAIAEGKDLAVNYPSASVGEYDFFYFEESEDEGTTKGHWQQLSKPKETEAEELEGFGTFKLQFDDTSYTELAPLNDIDWKAATKLHNPLNAENKWVLDEKWTMLDVSKPKYGFGEKVFNDSGHWKGISPDSLSILVGNKSSSRLRNRNGELILEVKNPDHIYRYAEVFNKSYFSLKRKDWEYIYDFSGKQLAKIERSFDKCLSSDESRLICRKYREPETVFIYTMKGKLVKTLHLKEYPYNPKGPSVYEHFILTVGDDIVVNDANGVSIYDLDGNLKQNRGELCYSVDTIGKSLLLLEQHDGKLTVWDYQRSVEVTSSRTYGLPSKVKDNHIVYGHIKSVFKTDYITIRGAGDQHTWLWNWKTNEAIKLDFEVDASRWAKLPSHLIEGYSSENSTYYVYDVEQKQTILSLPEYDPRRWEGSYHHASFTDNGQYFLINNGKVSRLYSRMGTLIRDFMAFDSSTIHTEFTSESTIGTISRMGIYREWNLKGEERKSIELDGALFDMAWTSDNWITTKSRSMGLVEVYDLDANLLFSDWNYFHKLGRKELLRRYYDLSSISLEKLFALEKDMYQLSLIKDDKQFHTYVYLTQLQKEAIERYEQARLVRFNAEKNRQKVETRIVRRFAIKKFGIYNYDRFVIDKSRIHLAASFDFGQAIDFNNITVFLITDFNGPSVIKFYKSTWDKFSFDPTKPNRLLAVLPDNKVAYFSQTDFDMLDIEAIKQSKAYQFNMKVSDKPIAELMDLEKVL